MNDGLSLSLTGAVPDVVVGAALGEPGLHRQHLLGPVQRLDLRLQRVTIAGLDVDLLSERGVVRLVLDGVSSGDGGWVVTPNVDIARQCAGDPACAALVSRADVVVVDGTPLRWLARLGGTAVPDRVTGSSLIFSLAEGCALEGRSVYILGGAPGVPVRAAAALQYRYPGLTVAGAASPALGFDSRPAELAQTVAAVRAVDPDVVFVGLGFPRQERLIEQLTRELPGTWFIGCGAAIPMAAGELRRAPQWMQRFGLEWLFRLLREPRRLWGRYLRDDLPYLAREAVRSVGGRRAGHR